MFQHANIKTPYWLGYLIQRPESHAVHHGRGIHRYNYSDLPLWDILFGTFRNPRTVEGLQVGFYRGASARIPEMLVGRDVTQPKLARDDVDVTAVTAEGRVKDGGRGRYMPGPILNQAMRSKK